MRSSWKDFTQTLDTSAEFEVQARYQLSTRTLSSYQKRLGTIQLFGLPSALPYFKALSGLSGNSGYPKSCPDEPPSFVGDVRYDHGAETVFATRECGDLVTLCPNVHGACLFARAQRSSKRCATQTIYSSLRAYYDVLLGNPLLLRHGRYVLASRLFRRSVILGIQLMER